MRKLYYLVLIAILTACESERFIPPCGENYLIAIHEQGAFCIKNNSCDKTSEILPIENCENLIGVLPDRKIELEKFYSDKLIRLEICLKSRKKCQ